jgi:uncharacterized protein involved in outer membrane biogenesis
MKKIIIGIGIGLVVILIIAVVAIGLSLDRIVKTGVETFGPKLTKVDVKLDKVSISILSGSGKIGGLVIGNPEGFKTPHAISVDSASLALSPGSLLSDKIVIKSIKVEAPDITFEGGLGGNNLSKLLANVEEAAAGEKTGAAKPAGEKPGKKLQVDDFLITGAKLHVSLSELMGGSSVPVPLPEIHLTGLGEGPEGITAAELTKRVLVEVEKNAAKAAADAATNLGKDAAKDATKAAGDAAGKAGKSIGDLFKKK